MPVPLTRFGPAAWNLEPPGVTTLMEKLRANGVPLKDFAGVIPYRGIMTGFDDAYLIDTPTKDRLVKADPTSAELFRPYLRGQDLDRWHADGSGLWMIGVKSSGNHPWPWAGQPEARAEETFRRTCPALFEHFAGYREELTKQQDSGEYWWELRACAYWERFDKPKLMYQEIQFHPSYLFDPAGRLANNKVFFLSTDDLYLLGVLNSPVLWWHNWRYLPHMKNEALSPVGFKMEELPIPRPADTTRAAVEDTVRRLIAITGKRAGGSRSVLDWLRLEFGVEKPSQRLAAVAALDAEGLIGEVKKLRGRKAPLSVADVKRLRAEHAAAVVPLQELDREAAGLERRVSDVVNAAFDLTPADVQLLWDTAPPRMPFASPG